MSRVRRSSRARRPSRGVILFLMLVCVLIAGALLAAGARSTVLRRLQQRQEAARLQAAWLADAGAARAAAQLAANPAYTGETWSVSAEALGGQPGGVSIKVAPDPLDERRLQVTATAVCPLAAEGAAPSRWQSQSTRITRIPKLGAGEQP